MYESYIYSTEKVHSQNVTGRPQATWWHFTVQQEPVYTLVRCTVVASGYIKCHTSSQLNHRTFLSVATSIPLGSTEGILWSGSSDTGNSAKWLRKALWMLLSRCTGIFEKKTHSLWIQLFFDYICSERAYMAGPSAMLRGMILPHITASATSSLPNENPIVISDMHCINFFFVFHPLFEVGLSLHRNKRSQAKATDNALDLRNKVRALLPLPVLHDGTQPHHCQPAPCRGNCFAFPQSHTRASDGSIFRGSKQKILQTYTQKCFMVYTTFFVL